VSDAVCCRCHRPYCGWGVQVDVVDVVSVVVVAARFLKGLAPHPPCVCVCVCVDVLCLVSFHFRFTFSLFALLLPAFIVELYSCRFHFILLYFTFFILSNLHFSPGCGLFFWQGWFPLTYINTYMNVCRTCDGVSYAPDFDPFPGGWDLRRLATHPSAVTLGKVSCK